MEGRETLVSLCDKLLMAMAFIETCGLAVGNREFFEENGQSIAMTLDAAAGYLRECRTILETLTLESNQDKPK